MSPMPRLETADGQTVLGNSTCSAQIDADTINITVVIGTHTRIGSGPVQVTAPNGLIQGGARGHLVALDHSTNHAYQGTAIATHERITLYDHAGNQWTGSSPFTLAPHDEIHIAMPRDVTSFKLPDT